MPVLPFWLTIYSQNFEAGVMPGDWAVVDSNGDGFSWQVVEAGSWYHNAMPPDPGSYIAVYDDHAAGFNYATVEELISPSINTSGMTSVRLIYGVGYQNYQDGDTLLLRIRSFPDTSWSDWDTLVLYDQDIGSKQETLDVSAWLPAESLQLEFVWADHSWGHRQLYAAVDNICLQSLYLPELDISSGPVIRPTEPETVGRTLFPGFMIKNTGQNPVNQDITGVMIIRDPRDSVVFADSSTVVGGLSPGDSLEMVFSAWSPPEAGGFYRAMAYHTFTDSVPGNDTAWFAFTVVPESVIRVIQVPYQNLSPVLDGVVEPGEWDSAAVWEVSDYLGLDQLPNPYGWCQGLAQHNGDTLFLCLICQDSLAFDTVEVFIDDNGSGSWPPQDTTEGRNRITRDSTLWSCAWFKQDYTYGPWRNTGLEAFAFCDTQAVFELAISMARLFDTGPEFLGVNPKFHDDTAGLLLRAINASGLVAAWPQDWPRFYDPAGFALFVLEASSSVQETQNPAEPRASLRWLGPDRLQLVLGKSSQVRLNVYDPAGRLIKTLFSGRLGPGQHVFDPGPGMGPGVFFVNARISGQSLLTKMVIPR